MSEGWKERIGSERVDASLSAHLLLGDGDRVHSPWELFLGALDLELFHQFAHGDVFVGLQLARRLVLEKT